MQGCDAIQRCEAMQGCAPRPGEAGSWRRRPIAPPIFGQRPAPPGATLNQSASRLPGQRGGPASSMRPSLALWAVGEPEGVAVGVHIVCRVVVDAQEVCRALDQGNLLAAEVFDPIFGLEQRREPVGARAREQRGVRWCSCAACGVWRHAAPAGMAALAPPPPPASSSKGGGAPPSPPHIPPSRIPAPPAKEQRVGVRAKLQINCPLRRGLVLSCRLGRGPGGQDSVGQGLAAGEAARCRACAHLHAHAHTWAARSLRTPPGAGRGKQARAGCVAHDDVRGSAHSMLSAMPTRWPRRA